MPHVLIDWLTDPGDTVYDPFSGRGTVPLESCLMGRVGLGSDANPLAWVLTAAKVDPPTRARAFARLEELRSDAADGPISAVPDRIRMLFSEATLKRLAWLKEELDLNNTTDRFLMAVLLGKLHANADLRGDPRGLTVAMPNTFAMAPGYVSRYIAEHDLHPPIVDPLVFLARHVDRIDWPDPGFMRGRAWIQDARDKLAWPRRIPSAKLMFTSPPYLSVMKYGKFNWIRLWLLGLDPGEVDATLFASSSLTLYLDFLSRVVSSARARLRDDGYLCLVVGDVRQEKSSLNLAAEVASVVPDSDLTLVGTVVDELPVNHKVSRIWGSNRGRATGTDRMLVFAGPKAVHPGSVPSISWKERPDGRRS
jgi:site-specific DNA-methyltransferase (adenine-specific)